MNNAPIDSDAAVLNKYPWLWATCQFWHPDMSTLKVITGNDELKSFLKLEADWLGHRRDAQQVCLLKMS